jgi:hypothetical protein
MFMVIEEKRRITISMEAQFLFRLYFRIIDKNLIRLNFFLDLFLFRNNTQNPEVTEYLGIENCLCERIS